MRKGARLFAAALCLLLAGCGGRAAEAGPAEAARQPAAQAGEPAESTAPIASTEEAGPEGAEPAEAADSYTGRWRDGAGEAGQCGMTVSKDGDGVYSIEIRWDREDSSAELWQFTGTYDEAWEGIDYIGTHYREEVSDGERQTAAVLEEETGLIYLDEDGALLWEDTFEHMGDGLRFTREA